jgi:hypothetical protein
MPRELTPAPRRQARRQETRALADRAHGAESRADRRDREVGGDTSRHWQKIANAAASQVAADLVKSPGRGPSEGEALVKWMAANEDAWRT